MSPLAAIGAGMPATTGVGPAITPPPGGGVAPFSVPEAPTLPPATNGAIAAAGAQGYAPGTWGQLLHQVVRDVNARQAVAGDKVRDVLAGGQTTPHEAVVAMEEASVSFQLLAEMRNKAVEAYQEVMRMQV